MALDPYDPCPCGSGKKLKFCCQAIAADMEKVDKLHQGGQPRLALSTLEKLNESHPRNPWIATTLASLALHEQRPREARQVLSDLVEEHPDHPFAIVLLAAAAMSDEGALAAKPLVHRAFQKCTRACPDMVGNLALGLASELFENGKYMAAREHLALGMRLVQEEDRQDVFVRLLELDGNQDVDYPLRSVHQIAPYDGPDDRREKHELAQRVATVGLWQEAARIGGELLEQEPDNPALWQNHGFWSAWDGNLEQAAASLHRAAELQADPDAAVELETIAQLLDLHTSDDRVMIVSRRYAIPSAARLLTDLENQPRLVRVELPPHSDDENAPSALYHVLDRDPPAEPETADTPLDQIARVVGQLTVYDTPPEEDATGPKAYVTSFQGEHLDTACELFQSAAGDAATHEDEQNDQDGVPREEYVRHWRWYFHPQTPAVVRRAVEHRKWEHVTDELWPETKLLGLDDKTPREVQDDPQYRCKLAAAVFVLDAFSERNDHTLDVDRVRRNVGLEPPTPFELDDDHQPNTLTAIQLLRLEPARLSDDQLTHVLNRGLLIHHSRLVGPLLREVLDRPSCREKLDVEKCYNTLAELARQQNDRQDALHWVRLGREQAEQSHGDEAFERVLQWRMTELRFRLEDPSDPELQPLLQHMWDYYGPKLPEMRPALDQIVAAAGVAPPWAGQGAGLSQGGTTQGGLWTPETAASSEPEGGKKLWLPGQD